MWMALIYELLSEREHDMNDETLGLEPCELSKRDRVHYERGPTDREIAIPLAGALTDYMYVTHGITACGDINDGVAIRMASRFGFVMPFKQLERWYEMAKAAREVQDVSN